jgi:hypothetical protein
MFVPQFIVKGPGTHIAASLAKSQPARIVGAVRKLRSLARLFPFQRAYHSVELTILIFIAAVGDLFTGDLSVTRFLLVALTVLGVVTIIGHFISIMTSSKLR